MSKRTPTPAEVLARQARAADRRLAAANDPWFGKRRRAGEMGRTKTRAEASRQACRGRVTA